MEPSIGMSEEKTISRTLVNLPTDGEFGQTECGRFAGASWDSFPKDTVGKQAVRSADSIGANIAEGVVGVDTQDYRRFVRIAGGSLCETLHWLETCLCPQAIDGRASQSDRSKPNSCGTLPNTKRLHAVSIDLDVTTKSGRTLILSEV